MAKKDASAAKAPATLTEKEFEGLREVKISNPLRALLTAFNYLTYKQPFKIYHAVARKMETASKKMMVGNASLIGMPLGIVLRNGARSAYNVSDQEGDTGYAWIGNAAGGLAVLGAVGASAFFGGPVIAAALGTGALATGAGYTIATAAAGLVLHRPVFTAGNIAVATVLAAAASVYSAVVLAPANLLVAFRRSKASFKGVKLTEDQLAQEAAAFDRSSPSARYERKKMDAVRDGLANLPREKKEQFYISLKQEFEPAAQVAAAQSKTAVPKAAGKPQGPQ